MRFHLCRWFSMSGRRYNFSGLSTENRKSVRIFLFLLAFAGSWQFMIWILANDAISAPYFTLSESNDSSSDPLALSRHESQLNATFTHSVNMSDSTPNSNPVHTALQQFVLADFHLVDEPENCSGNQLVSVIVSSAPDHFSRRQTIRQTWGQTARPVFFLGLTLNSSLAMEIRQESDKYGDIVQGFFVDAYRNLTYKHVMALAWADWKCPSKFILKVDDDVYVNSAKVSSYLQTLGDDSSAEDQDGVIYCDVVRKATVKRSFRSKWRVTFVEFPLYNYPDYCSGWAILYVRSTISRLLERIKSVPYLWVDDVYVSGLLAHEADVERKAIDHELLSLEWSDWDVDDSEKSEKQSKLAKILFGPPQLTAEQMTKMWNLETWKSL